MIQIQSMLNVADNSGAKKVKCIQVINGYKRRYAGVGDMVVAVVKEAAPHMPVKKSDIIKAVIVRTRKEVRRKDGVCLRFDDNACVLIDKTKLEPKGTRVFGPIAREVKNSGFAKIVSLAPEVL